MSDERGNRAGNRSIGRPSSKANRPGAPKPAKAAARRTPSPASGPSAVVGIGASAGGLDALRDFFMAMPPDSGMAFFVVQHLEPAHESRMADILSKYSVMPVAQAEDGMPVRANCVYTIPPGKYLSIRAGRLRLAEPPERHGMRMAIDFFLRSLAEDQQEKAICIILSGSGSDGTHGLRAVRGAGGMCLAQDPRTAQFGIMPQNAIDTGLVDHVLPADLMPAALMAYVRHPHTGTAGTQETADAGASDQLESILKLLQSRTDSDYRCYKKGTVLRRIERRMGLKQVAGMEDYLTMLRKDPQELAQLAKDMLIGVSSFFRDSKAFEDLRKLAIVPLVAGKSPDSPVRAWAPGCATGEEAYSVAILLLEALAAAGRTRAIQVFASDVDETALETARAGIYGDSIAADVSPERLERFFLRKDDHYQIGKQLRETVVFARQNLIADPPFSKMDLITCRNVLIYLQREAQEKVISLFSFALNVGGCLFLGKSDALVDGRGLFETISKPRRIYRLMRPNRHAADLPVFSGAGRYVGIDAGRAPAPPLAAELALLNQQMLLEHFGAAIVLVEPRGRILHFCGQTEKYLGHPKGPASLNLFDMATGSLATKLRRAMGQAIQAGAPVTIQQVPLSRKGSPPVNVTVAPVAGRAGDGKTLAIILEDASPTVVPRRVARKAADDESALAQLEADNRALRAELDETNQEHESVNEEIKAANEEGMSMNEELQAANEELETSTEELQSINEELNTVNGQLNEKIGELNDANNDLANLAGATEIATVFLDARLRIKQFTPRAMELLNLLPSDVGRPLSDITQNFDGQPLSAGAVTVLKDLSPVEREVRTPDGRWYTLRILPYRTLDGRIDGVVVTFSDVNRIKEAEAVAEQARAYAEGIIETAREPLVVLDANMRGVSANAAFYRFFRIRPEQVAGQSIYDWDNGQWDIPPLHELLDTVIPENSRVQDFPVEHDVPETGRRTLFLNARRIDRHGPAPAFILLAFQDVTEQMDHDDRLEAMIAERTADLQTTVQQLQAEVADRMRAEQSLRQSEARYRQITHALTDYIFTVDVEDGKPVRTVHGLGCAAVTGYAPADFAANPNLWIEMVPTEDRAVVSEHASRVLQDEAPGGPIEHRIVRKDGAVRWVRHTPLRRTDAQGRLVSYEGLIQDITERKEAELALAESEHRFRTVADFTYDWEYWRDNDRTFIYMSPSCERITGYAADEFLRDPDLLENIIHPDDRRVWAEHEQGRAAAIPLEFRIVRKDGKQRWISHGWQPVYGNDGRRMGVRASNRDTTEHRKLQDQFVQSQKMEAVGLLAGGVAHDFRNQLTVIKGYAEMLLRRGMVTEDGAERVKVILNAVQRSEELSSRLLAFSRNETYTPVVTRLGQFVGNLSRTLQSMLGEDIRLVTAVAPNAGNVNIDPGQLQQAVMNLITNARDAMPQGGEMTIEVANITLDDDFVRRNPGSSPGPHVLLAVKDSGVGMAPETIQRIFEPFFTTKPVGRGTGLGLSMVYGFVKQSGGCIAVESEPGKGTTFRICFPRVQQPAVPVPVQDQPPLQHAGPKAKTCLLVEDEPSVRRLTADTLKEMGHHVLEAGNAREALPIGEHYDGPIEILVTDVVMPDANGLELAERVVKVRPEIKVLYLSAYAAAALEQRGISLEPASLLRKPFSAEALSKAVGRLVAERRPAERGGN